MADTKVGTGSDDYVKRQSLQVGEKLFEQWAKDKGYVATVFGSNATDNYIPNFFRLNPILRNSPDYILNTSSKTFVVSVKGTANIKLKEIMLLDQLVAAYSSDKAPLIYAFCFKGHEPVLMSIDTLKQRFAEAENKQWHDGVIYRTIKI
jgi:hypothetical protein